MRQKKQIPWKTIGLTLLAALVGGAVGYWGMCQVDSLGLPGLLVLLLLLVLAYVLQVVVHEGGHLVCGLLTGYRALSFRIGRVLLVKLDGRWRLRAYHIPGTGGQCLMAPPAQENPPLPPVPPGGRAGQSAAGRPGSAGFSAHRRPAAAGVCGGPGSDWWVDRRNQPDPHENGRRG